MNGRGHRSHTLIKLNKSMNLSVCLNGQVCMDRIRRLAENTQGLQVGWKV